MGTSYAQAQHWDYSKFEQKYYEIAHALQNLPSAPELYLLVPLPVVAEFDEMNFKHYKRIVNNELPWIIQKVAKSLGLPKSNVILSTTAPQVNLKSEKKDKMRSDNVQITLNIYKSVFAPLE